jgi:anti-sigma regulatory factor (Ser/Thr protein kinase)
MRTDPGHIPSNYWAYDASVPSAQESFPPELSSVTEARRFLRRALDTWDAQGWEWSASQVLTELSTNAVIHARTAFEVELDFDGTVLKICVADGSPRLPVQRSYSDQATTGRGVSVIGTLAHSWGVETRANGKTVWCAVVADGEEGVDNPDLDTVLAGFDDLAEADDSAAGNDRDVAGHVWGLAA